MSRTAGESPLLRVEGLTKHFPLRGGKRVHAVDDVSFSILRDETRMREAMILLTESRLSLAELALRLGYSEESAFSRAVKAWWGAGPRELRRGSETP